MIKFKSNIDKTTMAFDNRTEAIKFIRKKFKKLEDLPDHITTEMEHFFNVYKAFEEKKVEIRGFRGKEEAMAIIEKSIKRYKEEFGK